MHSRHNVKRHIQATVFKNKTHTWFKDLMNMCYEYHFYSYEQDVGNLNEYMHNIN